MKKRRNVRRKRHEWKTGGIKGIIRMEIECQGQWREQP